jgi:hypothetical protein
MVGVVHHGVRGPDHGEQPQVLQLQDYQPAQELSVRRDPAFVVFFALLSYQPATVLFGMFVAYAISGFAVTAWQALRRRPASTG